MYLVIPALVQHFNFDFPGVEASDFECIEDDFLIGTKSRGDLNAYATTYDNKSGVPR